MQKRKLGATGIEIAPLVLGGNVFGWTADEATSFAILDAALAAGITAIDTADEDLCIANDIGVIPYFALAAGFLTGKYRSMADLAGKPREGTAASFVTPENLALLGRIDRVAGRHGATPAQVSLAWLIARPSVTAPIVSATSVAQLQDIVQSMNLDLSADDIAELENA